MHFDCMEKKQAPEYVEVLFKLTQQGGCVCVSSGAIDTDKGAQEEFEKGGWVVDTALNLNAEKQKGGGRNEN